MDGERVWLDIPYSAKDEAKRIAQVQWDPKQRRWWVHPDRAHLCEQWLPEPDLPKLLPREDRTFGSGLFVDLIPHSCWFTNVRSCVTEKDWDRIRRMVTGRAGDRCEACGATRNNPNGIYLEAHERWRYDERTRTQTLARLVCLCSPCHRTTHFGYARVTGQDDEAFQHLCEVTGMGAWAAQEHIDDAFDLWEHRNRHTWTLDISMLTDAGIQAHRPATTA